MGGGQRTQEQMLRQESHVLDAHLRKSHQLATASKAVLQTGAALTRRSAKTSLAPPIKVWRQRPQLPTQIALTVHARKHFAASTSQRSARATQLPLAKQI